MILLPVVSLTDDLHTGATLVEAEHLSRRGSLLPAHDIFLHTIVLAVTGFSLHQDISLLHCLEFPPPDPVFGKTEMGHIQSAAIRPPPVFA
ncbi:hypothetical protein [Paracidobacterium acidisoli]|uniref:hypothetical protein n=1 Tax=Paracidobacterium acidisoli TaxID=2303751 RepID=UPI0011C1B35E|nr:hypothetical protein [Paracidobacterium acidisoli]MBT9330646.1 hypothetical protein [Paracidobacterium acidisoli]